MTPSFESFILPYLLCLKDEKEHTMSELTQFCANFLNLSDADREERTKNGSSTKLYDRTQWSGTYLRKALLVESPERGIYKITQRGLSLLETNPTVINKKILSQYPEFLEFTATKPITQKPCLTKEIRNNTVAVLSTNKTPNEIMDDAYNEISESLIDDLLNAIKKQTPQFFERLVIKLLVAMGYGGSFKDAARVTQYSHDEGIDGIIKEDKLGLDSVYIQAKRYDNGTIGRKEIQSFVGALSGKGATKGIFLTTSAYTKEAIEYTPAPNIKIILIDGKQLCKYMIEYNIGVSTRQVYEIKRIDSDFFEEE